MTATLADWNTRGITCHFAQMRMNTGDMNGQSIVNIMVWLAATEAKLCSMRSREVRSELASLGKYTGGRAVPAFWRLWKKGKTKKLLLDPEQLAHFQYLRNLTARGSTIKDAFERLEAILAKRENRISIPPYGVKRTGKWQNIPIKQFPGNSKGTIFPLWTYDRYNDAKLTFDATMELWKVQKARDKEKIRELNRNRRNQCHNL